MSLLRIKKDPHTVVQHINLYLLIEQLEPNNLSQLLLQILDDFPVMNVILVLLYARIVDYLPLSI